MKKLLSLILVLTGMVSTASAAKLYVHLNSSTAFFPNDNARIMAHLWINDGDVGQDVEMTAEIKYGHYWYSCDLNGNTKAIIVRQNPSYGSASKIDWDNLWARIDNIPSLSSENDNYYQLWYNKDTKEYGVYADGVTPATLWDGLCIRSTIDGTDGYTTNMETSDYNSFTRTYTKTDIDNKNLTSGDKLYFKFKHTSNILFNEDGECKDTWTEIHPEVDTQCNFGESTNNTKQVSDEGNKMWYITIPSYQYEKITLSASYVKINDKYEWQISANAYISKSITAANEYATLGCSVPLDITSLPENVKAYTLTTSGNSIVKKEKTTTLEANKGVVLHNATGSTVNLSIPVAASGTSDDSNDLVAFTNDGNKLTQPGSDNVYYILANQNDHVGFYKVNTTSGNSMEYNTAYLVVPGAGAREFYLFDDVTAIGAVKQELKADGECYNLAGQRIAQPTKGLYIVNGKKYIVK